MIPPTVMGRWLPLNDWEGDDFPNAYKTCTATSAGRAVAFATNGRIDHDGKIYRAAAPSQPDGGQTLEQAGQAIATVAKLPLIIPTGWDRVNALTHLRYARGLIVQGKYSVVPRAFRYQAFAGFDHAMWFSHLSAQSGNFRGWDPLNPDTSGYGRWYPPSVFWAFVESLNFSVAFVPLQKL